ncbi:hypothetical protein IGS74_00260 [Aureimonas sp. OT7]|uniref:hypothetical protein n=1 Tax=Aureimonas sp. OT7 TaxID=2816454 RepID=UPI001782EA37|nr:hypothetical protein [Aureimonas sp. OT7]QOG06787.1 hypothetical protein IGS74_00260 [Aureimonas sp. OT7]
MDRSRGWQRFACFANAPSDMRSSPPLSATQTSTFMALVKLPGLGLDWGAADLFHA